MKDVFVTIQKMETREDAEHPDLYIPATYQKTVEMREDMFEKPKVDHVFRLFGHQSWFQSSNVVEIIEDSGDSGVFKTLNSVYYWELNENENETDGEN